MFDSTVQCMKLLIFTGVLVFLSFLAVYISPHKFLPVSLINNFSLNEFLVVLFGFWGGNFSSMKFKKTGMRNGLWYAYDTASNMPGFSNFNAVLNLINIWLLIPLAFWNGVWMVQSIIFMYIEAITIGSLSWWKAILIGMSGYPIGLVLMLILSICFGLLNAPFGAYLMFRKNN